VRSAEHRCFPDGSLARPRNALNELRSRYVMYRAHNPLATPIGMVLLCVDVVH